MVAGEAWGRLAQELRRRRIELDGRDNRTAFLDSKNIRKSQQRLMQALELTERDNYDEGTLTLAEIVYEWEPGSVAAVLAGDEPVPVEGVSVSRAPTTRTAARVRREIKNLVDELPASLLLRVRDDIRALLSKER